MLNGFKICKPNLCFQNKICKKYAFSLIEMLMALLVASLLLAALAPVMTRRMADHELKVMSEASNYEKDMVISVFNKDTNFTVPADANQVRITMMGGGGKGGDALYGNKEFTTSQTFTVPDGVTKLRVFMIGAGGGGASGGQEYDWQAGDIPTTAETYDDYTTVGETEITKFKKDGYGAPELDSKCKISGTEEWVLASDESINVPVNSIAASDVKVTACGAGGGGGKGHGFGGSGGGSGGYLINQALSISSSSIKIRIGSGGFGGTCSTSWVDGSYTYTGGAGGSGYGLENAGNGTTNNIGYGGGGGSGAEPSYNGGAGGGGHGTGRHVNCPVGGGGGGATSILSGGKLIFQIGGGGGGGGSTYISTAGSSYAGGGGAGGGKGAGCGGGGTSFNTSQGTKGGGGGGGGISDGNCTAGGAAVWGGSGSAGSTGTSVNKGQNGGTGDGYGAWGGAGGGGLGGAGGIAGTYHTAGSGGIVNSLFGDSHCNGGSSGAPGKPGALRMYYGGVGKKDVFKCQYKTLSNSGAGGGSGQIWIGEIDVTPGQTVSFNVGIGGNRTTSYSTNGNDGTSTLIVVNGRTYSVSGGRGGKYESDDTYISTSGGLGGGLKKESLGTGSKYVNWLNLDESIIQNMNNDSNKNGGNGNTVSTGAGGGNGASSFNMTGAILNGGTGGGVQSDGIDAISNNYGAGGGGGGGVTSYGSNPGFGGKGANGYIFIEWGGSNGGGGTAGEIVKTTLTNLDPDPTKRTMKIRIGRGGGITGMTADDDSAMFDSSTLGSNGNGGETSISIISGGKTVTHKAKGGAAGNNGTVDNHGAVNNLPSGFSELYKEYIQGNMNIILGQKGTDDYGGMGGYLSCIFKTKDEEGNSICTSTIKANDGTDTLIGPTRPGCGGTSIPSPLYDAICNAKSTTASPDGGSGTLGAGGGGGAVLNLTQGKGGSGGNGFVILEYKSTTLD